MSARDDYPTMASGGFDDAEIGAMLDELDRLRRWKAEAIEVLRGWDACFDFVQSTHEAGELGDRKSSIVLDALRRNLP